MAGPAGLLAGGRKGLYIVDCSTSEPASTARLRDPARDKGMVLVDAPLARTPVEAEQGRLNVMIGASAEDFGVLEPVLKTFAENVFHVGEAGAGHVVKLLNNFIAQAICTAAAEAFAVGSKAGIDPGRRGRASDAVPGERAWLRRRVRAGAGEGAGEVDGCEAGALMGDRLSGNAGAYGERRLPGLIASGNLPAMTTLDDAAPGARFRASRRSRLVIAALLAASLWACGGGSGGDRSTTIPASDAFAGKCAPDNSLARDSAGNLTPRYTAGTLADEKSWVSSYMDEAYLWYKEIPQVDPALAAYNVSPTQVALGAWFEALKTPVTTPSGAKKDRYSFTLSTAQWNALSQSGVVSGYGIEWTVASPTPPRNARVAYVEAQSQAASAGVARGDSVLTVTVDGAEIDFVNTTNVAEIDKLNQVIFAPTQGQQTAFRLRSNGGAERSVQLTASQVTTTPVKEAKVIDAGGSNVGYLLFNDFILPGEGPLKTAMENFRNANVRDLILDLRYNGGGYLYMASQLAYMIAPPARTAGKTFERSVYSDKRGAATSSASSNLQFFGVSSGVAGSNTAAGSSLPSLALERVYVLTTGGTCSASESVINGLRGVDIEVIVLGASTCGKPYGFTAKDNCGLSYFPVEFQGVNEKGFGDFAGGFLPTCPVDDDLNNPLGSQSEGLLAAALAYREGGSCAAIAAGGSALKSIPHGSSGSASPAVPGTLVRPPARSNKYLMP